MERGSDGRLLVAAAARVSPRKAAAVACMLLRLLPRPHAQSQPAGLRCRPCSALVVMGRDECGLLGNDLITTAGIRTCIEVRARLEYSQAQLFWYFGMHATHASAIALAAKFAACSQRKQATTDTSAATCKSLARCCQSLSIAGFNMSLVLAVLLCLLRRTV